VQVVATPFSQPVSHTAASDVGGLLISEILLIGLLLLAPGRLPLTTTDAPPIAQPVSAEVAESIGDRVASALANLSNLVREQSHPDALRLAFHAYHSFARAHPEQVRNPYLYFVDFGLDSRVPRGYVFDMRTLTVVEGPFTVAHGRGSGAAADVPRSFSNVPGSLATSLGLYVAQETYSFNGRQGSRSYKSIGLRLNGVSAGFNDAARMRGVVAHGAPYVTPAQAGRSEGCPAMEEQRARRLLPLLADGGLVFHFSPRDAFWLRHDPWVNADSAPAPLP
jgi:hypothetical protein